jgi:hypothetical protein
MPEHIVKFTREKVTKNTVRFIEDPVKGHPPVIGSLYVQKWAAGDAATCEVTLRLSEK